MKRVLRTPSVTLELAALIDIVFILLIFFVVTSSVIDEVTLQVNLPDVTAATGVAELQNRVVLVVTAENEIWIANEAVEDLTTEGIAERITAYSESNADIEVEIRADEDSRHAAVVLVLDALALLGITNVNLITEKSQ